MDDISNIGTMKIKIAAIAVVVALVLVAVVAYVATSDDEGGDYTSTVYDYKEVGLTILGNANGDYTIDQNDLDTIESLVSEGKTGSSVHDKNGESHFLADADGNGSVDENDVSFVREIIAGQAESISILDGHGNFATVNTSPERVVCEFYSNAEILQLMGAQQSIVAADTALMLLDDYYLQGAIEGKVIDMGGHRSPDYEKVQELDPDLWLTYGDTIADKSSKTTATVVGLNLTDVNLEDIRKSGVVRGTLLAGYIFNNVEAAERYVDWVVDLWTQLDEVSSKLSDDDRPTVFYTGYGNYIVDDSKTVLRCFLEGTNIYQAVELAGGRNLIDDFNLSIEGSESNSIDLEAVLDNEFDYVFVHSIKFTGGGTADANVPMHGYTTDDSSEWDSAHDYVASLMPFRGLPEGNVVLSAGDFMNNASGGLLNAVLVATTINPSLYPDLDMQEIHQQYIDIMGFDFDLSQHGVF